MGKKRLLVMVLSFSMMLGMYTADCMAQQKVFKLGILGPFTGPAGKTGQEMKVAAAMAFEKMGNKIGDYKIELVYIDDQSDAAKSSNAYAEAIERLGVQAGILNWNTAVTVSCLDIWAKYKVPHFFTMGAGKAGNDKWNSFPPDKRYLIVKGWPIPQKMVVGYVDYISYLVDKGIWKPSQKVAAFWGEDTDWGRGVVGGIRDGLVQKGWKVFTEEYFALTQTDFYPYLSKCKQGGVTLLAGSTTGIASASGILKQSTEIGLNAVRVADGLGWVGDWYKLTGAASDGVLDMIPSIATPEQKAWAKEFETKHGYTPSPSAAGLSYDYSFYFAKIARRAIERFGKLDSESIFKVGSEEVANGKLTYTNKDGALFMNQYGTTPQDAPDPKIGVNDFYFPVLQYKAGKGPVVWPEGWKEADFIPPK